jgi:hypothetical protein
LGLDATVYLRGYGPDDDDCADHTAIDRRLGNVGTVAHIRGRVAEALPTKSIICSRVIHTGTHSGDELELALVPRMLSELCLLDGDTDPDMQTFVASMRALGEAALAQANPICF